MGDDNQVLVRLKAIANTKQLDTFIAKMKAVQALERRFSSNDMLGSLSKGASKWKKSFDFVDKAIRGFGMALTKFLGMAIKGVILEMAAMGAAMLATHALFIAGKFLMKAYSGAMQVVAGGAAAAAIAIGTFAAAMREQQAAMYAYRGKGMSGMGAGINQVQVSMRALHNDAALAGIGVENLNKAFAVMSKTMGSAQIVQGKKSLKALMDFGSAGQDPAKGVESAAAVVAALSDQKKTIGDVMAAAKKMGPEMEKAMKGTKIKSKAQFKELLFSGELAEKGGVTGQFDTVNNTLIGQLKTYMGMVKSEFADFGMQFLEPAKVAFEKIMDVIKRDIARISAAIQGTFGSSGMFDGFASMVDKFSNWMVKTIREYLPKAQGMFDRMGDWLNRFKIMWNNMLDYLRPLIDGAKVLEKAFGRIWQAIKNGAKNLGLFGDLLQENENTVMEFGDRMAGFIDSFSTLFTNLKKQFFTLLPFINDVLAGVKMIFDVMTKMLTTGSGGGFMKALAPLLLFKIVGSKMAGAGGRLSPVSSGLQNMNVTAQNVNLNTPGGIPRSLSSGGPTGSSAAMSSGGPRGSIGPSGYAAMSTMPGALPYFTKGNALSGLTAGTRSQSIEGNERMGSVYRRTAKTSGMYSHDFYAPGQYAQSSQGLMSPISMQNVTLRQAMRAGADLKGGYTKGAEHAAGANTRDYMRQQMLATPVGSTAFGRATGGGISPWGVPESPTPLTNYHNLSARQLEKVGRARGFTGGSIAQGLYNQDRDRATMAGVASGSMPASMAMVPSMSAATRAEFLNPAYVPGGTAPQYINQGLPAAEQKARQKLTRQTIRQDRVADLKMSGRRGAGGLQGLMGFMNQGRFDMSLSGGMVPELNPDGTPVYEKTKSGKIKMKGGQPVPVMRQQQGARVDMAGLRKTAKQNNQTRALQTGRGPMRTKIANMRDQARLNRTQTTFGAGMSRFAGSAGGRMGSSMGLSMLSQYAPEEMQGAMALGGTLSMIDPRLGMAVAGIGGALKAQSVGSGMMAGAMGGAQIGGMFGAHGAVIGAAIGALAGGIMGFVNKGKNQLKKAKETAQASLAGMFTDIATTASKQFKRNNEILEGGGTLQGNEGAFQNMGKKYVGRRKDFSADLKAVSAGKTPAEAMEWIKNNASKYGMKITKEQQGDMSKSPVASLAEFTNGRSEFESTLLGMDDVNNKRLEQLGKATGKSVPALEKLAKELGVNLYDATLDYTELAKQMGTALIKTSGELKNAMIDIVIGAGNIFKKKREGREAQLALDQSGAALSAELDGSDMTADDKKFAVEGFMENYGTQALAMYGGDPAKAYQSMQKGFGTRGEGLFGKGQQFEGQEDFIMPAANELQAEMKKGLVDMYAEQLKGMAGDASMQMDSDALTKQLTDLANNPAEFDKFINIMGRDGFSMKDTGGKARSVEDVTKGLSTLGLTGTGLSAIPAEDLNKYVTSAETFDKSSKEFKEAVSLYKDTTASYFSTGPGADGAPAWWSKGLAFDAKTGKLMPDGGDTSTPRGGAIGDTTASRLSRTMGRHSEMDGQLKGTRKITSSYRDYNLGSPSSDHVTGRAYDLTGQNLGAYKKLVHANGGFSEFHGNNANRHLHVVPGPGGRTGDSSSAQGELGASTMSMSGSNSNYYNIYVNTNDPEAAAREVMRKLKDLDTAARERG